MERVPAMITGDSRISSFLFLGAEQDELINHKGVELSVMWWKVSITNLDSKFMEFLFLKELQGISIYGSCQM